jgi:excisionase family DNA binding protein
MKTEKIYYLKEFCEVLQISQDTGRDLLWSHKCAYRKIGGRFRISQTDLDDFLSRTRIAAYGEAVGSSAGSKKAT